MIPPPSQRLKVMPAGPLKYTPCFLFLRRTYQQEVHPGVPRHHIGAEDLVRGTHVQRRRLTVLEPDHEEVKTHGVLS